VLLSGLLYTLGRVVAYVVVGVLVVRGVLSIPGVSSFLQGYVNKVLGPLLVLAGVFLLEIVPLPVGWNLAGDGVRKRAEAAGAAGAGLLGIVFALSFCPISAALFFGSLIPLAIAHESTILLPTLYGIGTGLPVALFAILVALGAHAIGDVFNRLAQIEWWARRITGVVFILVGLYFCFHYIYGVI
jgi:cytochrome c biogenesis protein CcdA